jgi:hypothetical protein
MQTLRGKGKIYDTDGSFLSEAEYEIYYRTTAKETWPEWWGEIIPNDGIIPAGSHILELEDGRRGLCIVSIKTTSSFGLVVDSFHVESASPLTN